MAAKKMRVGVPEMGKQRTGYFRVLSALRGKAADRIPRGELKLPPGLVMGITGRKEWVKPVDRWRAEEEALSLLGADMTSVIAGKEGPAAEPGSWEKELNFWAGRDWFIWVMVDGPFESLVSTLGWQLALKMFARMMKGDASATTQVRRCLAQETRRAIVTACRGLCEGADGILLGDDIAYSQGLLVPPGLIRSELLPLWAEIVCQVKAMRTASGDVPLIAFHSDGDIRIVLEDLVAAGFDAVHSLEPEAGIDLASLLPRYRGRLGLMGGLSVTHLTQGGECMMQYVCSLSQLARQGGLVVGSAAGILPDGVPINNVVEAYNGLG